MGHPAIFSEAERNRRSLGFARDDMPTWIVEVGRSVNAMSQNRDLSGSSGQAMGHPFLWRLGEVRCENPGLKASSISSLFRGLKPPASTVIHRSHCYSMV